MAATRTTRWLRALGGIALACLLAACTAPAPQAGSEQASAPVPSAGGQPVEPPASVPPPVSKPLPPQRGGTQPVNVDRSCRTDADCAVKDVGNCCGYFPACVNKASPTDPAGVKAQCAASGMASVCGFQEISACTCTAGKCEAAGGAAPVAQ